MATHITHVTRTGERWDQIAAKYYGDPLRYEPIVAANPDVPIQPVLNAGITLIVPLLDDLADVNGSTAAASSITASDADLPPWKR